MRLVFGRIGRCPLVRRVGGKRVTCQPPSCRKVKITVTSFSTHTHTHTNTHKKKRKIPSTFYFACPDGTLINKGGGCPTCTSYSSRSSSPIPTDEARLLNPAVTFVRCGGVRSCSRRANSRPKWCRHGESIVFIHEWFNCIFFFVFPSSLSNNKKKKWSLGWCGTTSLSIPIQRSQSDLWRLQKPNGMARWRWCRHRNVQSTATWRLVICFFVKGFIFSSFLRDST